MWFQTAAIQRSTPAMTVGGTGDVLSGLAAGFLAKGMKPFDAAVVPIYTNGISVSIAFRHKGLHIAATDLSITCLLP